MDDNKSKYEYITPVDELDRLIEQIDRGITPMLTNQLEIEIKLRMKELENQLIEEGEIDEDDSLVQQHKAMMQKVAEQRRSATKRDVVIIKISDEQKKQIREEMETSIVRTNPNSPYNLRDEELYDTKERMILEQKRNRLKNCYYHAEEYKNAILIIRDIIMYSLEHDYPWLPTSEVINMFNEGRISFSGNIPKLYLNLTTQVTDQEILKGVVTGEVQLIDKDENKKKEFKKKEPDEPVKVDYTVISHDQYEHMKKLHMQGYDTPIAPFIKANMNRYNRFTLPLNERFGIKPKEQDQVQLFDWMQDNAGEKYTRLMNGQQYTTNDFMRDLNEINDGELNNTLNTNLSAFLTGLKYKNTNTPDYVGAYQSHTPENQHLNQQAYQIEQSILNAIRMNNPNK